MPERYWEVIGGEDKGGILVRVGKALDSAMLPERLSTGAIVQEIIHDEAARRMKYRRIQGTGPITGFVTTNTGGSAGKWLLRRKDDYKTGPGTLKSAASAPKAKAVSIPAKAQVFSMETGDMILDAPAPKRNVSKEEIELRKPNSIITCPAHPRCVRPPGHQGPCLDGSLKVLEPLPQPIRYGRFQLKVVDETPANDSALWEIELKDDGVVNFQCIPQGSFYRGGLPSWECEGRWDDEKGDRLGRFLTTTVTRSDIRGPKKGTEYSLQIAMDGAGLLWDVDELKRFDTHERFLRLQGFGSAAKLYVREPEPVHEEAAEPAAEPPPGARQEKAQGKEEEEKEAEEKEEAKDAKEDAKEEKEEAEVKEEKGKEARREQALVKEFEPEKKSKDFREKERQTDWWYEPDKNRQAPGKERQKEATITNFPFDFDKIEEVFGRLTKGDEVLTLLEASPAPAGASAGESSALAAAPTPDLAPPEAPAASSDSLGDAGEAASARAPDAAAVAAPGVPEEASQAAAAADATLAPAAVEERPAGGAPPAAAQLPEPVNPEGESLWASFGAAVIEAKQAKAAIEKAKEAEQEAERRFKEAERLAEEAVLKAAEARAEWKKAQEALEHANEEAAQKQAFSDQLEAKVCGKESSVAAKA